MANYGRFGCDSNEELLEKMLKLLEEENPDVILVPGDIAGHDMARRLDETGPAYDYKYEEMLKTLTFVGKSIQKHFPNALILPTIGNNDTEFHYQSPNFGGNKENYYDTFFNSWFTEHKANKNLTNFNEIEQSFKKGGFYKAVISD